MPTVTYTTEVDVDVDLDDIDADDLASALEDKGYFVIKNDKDIEKRLIDQLGVETIDVQELDTIVAALRQGRKEEGFILLERAFPTLKGLLLR